MLNFYYFFGLYHKQHSQQGNHSNDDPYRYYQDDSFISVCRKQISHKGHRRQYYPDIMQELRFFRLCLLHAPADFSQQHVHGICTDHFYDQAFQHIVKSQNPVQEMIHGEHCQQRAESAFCFRHLLTSERLHQEKYS